MARKPCGTARTLLIGLGMAGLAACGGATNPEHALELARARWAQHKPASYRITVARWCECAETGPVVVTVRDDAIESRHFVADGTAVPPEYAELFPSVEGLFERIEAARRERVARLDVRYDPTYGYPSRIAIDQHARSVDDEVTYEAKDFVVRQAASTDLPRFVTTLRTRALAEPLELPCRARLRTIRTP